jgi:FkbH-like protein
MGNTAMMPKRLLLWQERVIGLVAPLTNAIGPFIARLTGDVRWTYPMFGISRRFCAWLNRRNRGHTKPDAFLLEIYNPADTLRLQLAMDYAPEMRKEAANLTQIRPIFRTTLEVPKGYSRHEYDRRVFQAFTETGSNFNMRIVPEADNYPRLVFLTADFVTYSKKKTMAQRRSNIKCVVLDLDNTTWDGVLVEGDDVRLKPEVKTLLEALDQRGILLSIASKNDHDLAWQRLQSFGIGDYFLVPQINWMPKSGNIKAIATKLNIGLDTLAFIDDNPFELKEVSSALPDVTCVNVQDIDDVLSDARFQGSNTADAKNRRRYYQEAITREDKEVDFGHDYIKFLEYCEIQLEVRPYQEPDFDRVAELIQRTNQLNFSGHKYERDQLHSLLSDPAIDKYILYCSDRFGSYGLIGFSMILRVHGEIEVQDLMLSCRVQGKLIEQAFFSHLEKYHNPGGASRVRVNFTETERNRPARQALEAAQFTKLEGASAFTRELGQAKLDYGVIRVRCSAHCTSGGEFVATGDRVDSSRQ